EGTYDTRPHPDRVRHPRVGAGGQVRTAGVAEVAEPLRVAGAVGQLTLERHEDVVADDVGATLDVAAYLAGRGVEGERDVARGEVANDRATPRPLPGPAAVEPETTRMLSGDLREVLLGRAHETASTDARKLATSAAPDSESTGSGWTCTPSSGSERWRTPITVPSSARAVTSSSAGTVSAASEW